MQMNVVDGIPSMTYPECIGLLTALGHELRGMKFDLDGIRATLNALGNPQRAYPTVIVAGTNGKGSTCAMLASILDSAGYRTGLYTSPHLVRVNERIRVSRQDISDEAFAAVFSRVWQTVEDQVRLGILRQRLSFFETLTATAFLYFAQLSVEIAVLEVGMGGRLDATNVTEPRVAIITNVDLDHEEFLGHTRALIAGEKCGVIRPGRPVISGCEYPEARDVIRERCQQAGAELFDLEDVAFAHNVRDREGQFVFDLTLRDEFFRDVAPALAGRFQLRNAIAAVAAAWRLRRQALRISDHAISAGLRNVRWPGRLQAVHSHPLVLLDGGHNPAGARALESFIREHFSARRLRLVYASMRDKSIEEISAVLFPLAAEVYLTQTSVVRSASPQEIAKRVSFDRGRMVIEPDPARALERAYEASNDEDVVLVAGSLYLVGAVQQAISEGTLSLQPSSVSRTF
jgi:dihydrofolate synthase / folylpolyglutamate synthase